MEDEVERFVLERQRARHVHAHGADLITLALGNHDLGRNLRLGVVEHRALAAHGSKDRHLLATARGKAKHTLSAHLLEEPIARHLPRRREHHRPVAAQRRQVALVRDGLPPLPTVSNPRVHNPCVHIRVRFGLVLQ